MHSERSKYEIELQKTPKTPDPKKNELDQWTQIDPKRVPENFENLPIRCITSELKR
jgi:hypothetical protein